MEVRHRFVVAATGLVALLTCRHCPGDAPKAQASASDRQLSVRQRLQRAIDVTRELEGKARHLTKEEVGARGLQPSLEEDRQPPTQLRCSSNSEVARYTEQRPWTTHYSRWYFRWYVANPPKWPRPADAPSLRELLGDDDSAVRCMAMEALATLHLPEDVPRIARLLDDESDGLPVLGWNRDTNTLVTFSFVEPQPRDADVMRSWHARKVKDYARLALRLITGESFTSASFVPWWEHNKKPRHSLWYWQQRLDYELDEANVIARALYSPTISSDRAVAARMAAEQAREIEAREDAVRQRTAEELRGLPAEVEAKVRLLVTYRQRGSDFFCPDDVWRKIGPLRLSPERLLDLLDHRALWKDVDWRPNRYGYSPYNRMVQRLMLAAPDIFGTEHVDRLRAVMDREKDQLNSHGRAALLLGISRLMPPAAPDNLDDPHTRDGMLRAAVRGGSPSAVCELVRVGLPQNWPLLTKQFFATSKPSLTEMITALGTPPLTDAKRAALADLLLDEQFKPLWKAHRWCRACGMRAVNAHAGREVFPEPFPKELDDQTLPEVLQKVAEALK